ncbi:hypothetical protein BV25DRAFT_763403 [Artomyces pyxidatus]|uniref:Uncharacterized protein n=1 Tax=Artomyces pyxidatus TaxID=48021 RepID=A0ACB8SZ87_9AGAM|nr:hypothetical protein BV25DRAFT_763403 [Artomyces pyxidatus]
MQTSLFLLPTEMLVGILQRLKVGDILSCAATCRRLHTVITDSVQLQYEVELFAAGMFDGAWGPDTLPIQDRRDRLQRYTIAWERLVWTNQISLPHLTGFAVPVSVSGDVFILSKIDSRAASVHVQQIPSALRAVDESHIVQFFPKDSPIFSAQLDSSQDLLVAVNGHPGPSMTKLHVRSLSTGEAHPRAGVHGFTQEMVSPGAGVREVCGDFLLDMITSPGGATTPTLRNWTTGFIEATAMTVRFARPIFLDTQHILYTAAGSGRDASDRARLCVTSLVPGRHGPAESYLYSFSLPEFLLYDVAFVDSRTSTLETGPAPHGCFYSDPADRLISIELIYINWTSKFIIDVPSRTLTQYIAAHPAAPGEPAVLVPWDAWGAHGARVTAYSVHSPMWWAVSGSRRATVSPRPGATDSETILTVLDYSLRRVARAVARGTENVVHESDVAAEHMREGFGELHTLLPCIATDIPVPDSMAGEGFRVSLCENGVLFATCEGRRNIIRDAWAYTI